jgi:hypothetical protein
MSRLVRLFIALETSLLQLDRVVGDILLKRRQLSASILSGPFHLLLRLWPLVAEVLEVVQHLEQVISSSRRQEPTKGALGQLAVLDSLARRRANDLYDLFE